MSRPPMSLIVSNTNVKALDLNKLRTFKEDREKKRIKVYEEILKKCHHRIKTTAQREHDYCFYKVPEFIFGIPIYNLSGCICFIIYKLRKNGFSVNYIYPNYIFISWKKSAEEEEAEYNSILKNHPNIKEFMPINTSAINNSNSSSTKYYKNIDNTPPINPMLVYDDSALENLKLYSEKMNR